MDLTRQVYRNVVALLALCSLLSHAAGDRLEEAIQLIRQGQWKEAETVIDQISSTNVPVLYWKAYLFLRTARYSECRSVVAMYLAQKPDSAPGLKVLGLCSFMNEAPEQAEQALRRATEIDPSDTEALYYLGRLYFTSHNLPAALSRFERLTTLDKSSVRGFNHLGQTYEGLSRFEDAKVAYLKAIQLEQAQTVKSEWPYFNLGVLYVKEGRAQEAVDLLREAVKRNVNWSEGKIKLAVALFSSDRPEDARVILSEVLATDPKNADAYYQMGRLLLKAGNRDEAHEYLQRFQSLRKQH